MGATTGQASDEKPYFPLKTGPTMAILCVSSGHVFILVNINRISQIFTFIIQYDKKWNTSWPYLEFRVNT